MKKVLLGMLLTLATVNAVAQETEPANKLVIGLGYTNFSSDVEGDNISIDLVVGSVGYKIEVGNNFYITPELRIGTSVKEDTYTQSGYIPGFGSYSIDVDVELKRFVAFAVRAQYELNNGVYFYIAPAYANAEFEQSFCIGGDCHSKKDDSWKSGFGGGAGFAIGNSAAIETRFEKFGDADVFSIGLKFNI